MAKSGQGLTVYYDGWCPLCISLRGRIERLDWLGLISFVSIREPGVAKVLGVNPEQLSSRMHTRHSASGKVAEGIHAVVAVATRLPILWPLWPVLRLLAWLGLGQLLYDLIARQRKIIPVGACDDQGCPLVDRVTE